MLRVSRGCNQLMTQVLFNYESEILNQQLRLYEGPNNYVDEIERRQSIQQEFVASLQNLVFSRSH